MATQRALCFYLQGKGKALKDIPNGKIAISGGYCLKFAISFPACNEQTCSCPFEKIHSQW
jgi:hypothetical protein